MALTTLKILSYPFVRLLSRLYIFSTAMDTSTVIKNLFENKTMPKLLVKNEKLYSDVAENDSETDSDALLAVKKDPAVLEVRVKRNDYDVPSMFLVQSLNSPKKFQSEQKHILEFEKKLNEECAALLSLPSDQLQLLLKYVDTLRRQRITIQRQMECRFCKKNKEPEVWYTTHVVKDRKGRVTCPILRSFVCPRCGATGDRAHTISHCPLWN